MLHFILGFLVGLLFADILGLACGVLFSILLVIMIVAMLFHSRSGDGFFQDDEDDQQTKEVVKILLQGWERVGLNIVGISLAGYGLMLFSVIFFDYRFKPGANSVLVAIGMAVAIWLLLHVQAFMIDEERLGIKPEWGLFFPYYIGLFFCILAVARQISGMLEPIVLDVWNRYL